MTTKYPSKNRVLLYLAGPISHVSHREATAWRKLIADEVQDSPAIAATFDPSCGFTCSETGFSDPGLLEPIQAINDTALLLSSAMVLRIMLGVESSGTDGEVRLAAKIGLPILCWGCPQDAALEYLNERGIQHDHPVWYADGLWDSVDLVLLQTNGGALGWLNYDQTKRKPMKRVFACPGSNVGMSFSWFDPDQMGPRLVKPSSHIAVPGRRNGHGD